MEYVYAALLLHKLGQEVNEDNVKKVVVATGTEVDDSKIKSLVASLKGVDIEKELESASLAAAPAASAPASEGGDKDGEGEAEPEEDDKKGEAAAEGLGALFG